MYGTLFRIPSDVFFMPFTCVSTDKQVHEQTALMSQSLIIFSNS